MYYVGTFFAVEHEITLNTNNLNWYTSFCQFNYSDCPKPTMLTNGRFILTGNGTVLTEECGDGFSITNTKTFYCSEGTWQEIKIDERKTCNKFGKQLCIKSVN